MKVQLCSLLCQFILKCSSLYVSFHLKLMDFFSELITFNRLLVPHLSSLKWYHLDLLPGKLLFQKKKYLILPQMCVNMMRKSLFFLLLFLLMEFYICTMKENKLQCVSKLCTIHSVSTWTSIMHYKCLNTLHLYTLSSICIPHIMTAVFYNVNHLLAKVSECLLPPSVCNSVVLHVAIFAQFYFWSLKLSMISLWCHSKFKLS